MRILLAGAQSGGHFRDLQHVAQYVDGGMNLLMSYYYLRKMNQATLENLLDRLRELKCFVMLDSGAHTFFSYHGESLYHRKHIASQANVEVKDKAKGYVEPEVYHKEYIEFLKKYSTAFDCFAELDIDTVVGYDRVLEWREEMDRNGLTPIPVYHSSIEQWLCDQAGLPQSWPNEKRFRQEEWKRLVDRYPYIGIQGGMSMPDYAKLLKVSDAGKVKVHGFAMTSQMVFRYLPFYSIDSTSWLGGQKYGVTFVVQGSKLKTIESAHKARRKSFKRQCDRFGIDFKKFVEDDPYEVNRFNAASWVSFQQVLNHTRRNDVGSKLDESAEKALDEAEDAEFQDNSAEDSASAEDAESAEKARAMMLSHEDNETEGTFDGDGSFVDSVPVSAEAEEDRAVTLRHTDSGNVLTRNCDQCYLADSCPYFKPKSSCSVPFGIPEGEVITPARMIMDIIRMSWERLHFAYAVEKSNGGTLDDSLSKERDKLIRMLVDLKELSSGPKEEVTIVAKGKESGGILAKMFAGYGRQGAAGPGTRES